MQVPFVGFNPISTSEHMAAAGKYHFICHNRVRSDMKYIIQFT